MPFLTGRYGSLVLLSRGTNSSTYRLVALETVGGNPILEQAITGDALVLVPPTTTRSEVNVNSITDANFPVTLSGVGGIRSGTAHEVIIDNQSNTRAANLSIGGNLTFDKTPSQRLVIPPSSDMSFIWRNTGGTPSIKPNRAVEYEFTMTTADIVGNGATAVNWENIPDILDHLVYSPASGQANANALITRPGVGCQIELRLEWLGGWGGPTAPAYTSGTTVDVEPQINGVGDSMGDGIIYTQFHRAGAPQSFSRTWSGFMTAGQMMTLSTTNLENTGPRMIEVQAHVKLTFKAM